MDILRFFFFNTRLLVKILVFVKIITRKIYFGSAHLQKHKIIEFINIKLPKLSL